MFNILYIIGGASRSGKSILSQRLLKKRYIPYFSLDFLFKGILNGTDEISINPFEDQVDICKKLWRINKAMIENILYVNNTYCIEGDILLPSQIHELVKEDYKIKCCFLGYPKLSIDEKIYLMEKYPVESNNWMKYCDVNEVKLYLDNAIKFSKYLKQDCVKYNIKFFDISNDFKNVLLKAEKYLLE